MSGGGASGVFDSLCEDLIRRIAPSTLLDIGPGQGRYGTMSKRVAPTCRTHAVEISNEYKDKFGLENIYDQVSIADAASLVTDPAWRNRLFDVVTIGDCIEHMPKSQGLDLLNFLTYRCGYLIVIAPEFAFYDTGQLEHTESHISVWSEFDFEWHDRFAFVRSEIMQVFVLRGYQQSSIALHDLVAQSNQFPVPLSTFSGHQYKTSELQLRTRERIETINGTNFFYRQP